MLEVVRGEGEKMEQEFDSKMRIQDESSNNGNCNGGIQRGKSFQFRAPQENFTVEDFELGKIYGVGSYSKVHFLFMIPCFLLFYFWVFDIFIDIHVFHVLLFSSFSWVVKIC